LTDAAIETTRAHLATHGLASDLRRVDAETLPFADGSFDVVWSWGVLPYVPDPAGALADMRRVLRPGGEVRLMIYNRHSLYNWLGIVARYGIVRRQLLRRSVAELWSRYSDGRDIGGSPFVRYSSAAELRGALRGFDVLEMRTFEQKALLTWWAPRSMRRAIEARIPDAVMRVLFGKVGMLLYCRARRS
jgi:SAM-dependent methyltransferase